MKIPLLDKWYNTMFHEESVSMHVGEKRSEQQHFETLYANTIHNRILLRILGLLNLALVGLMAGVLIVMVKHWAK